MKSTLTKVQIFGLLIALPALANDVGLHKGSAQPTRAAQAQNTISNKEHTMGLCLVVSEDVPQIKEYWDERELNVVLAFDAFADKFWGNDAPPDISSKNVELINQPNHGKVTFFTDNSGETHFSYLPNPGHLGTDKLSFKVNVDGNTFNMDYFLKIVKYGSYGNTKVHESLCPEYGWKISTTPNLTDTARVGWAK